MSKKTTVSKEPESELQQLEQKLAHDIDEITKPENAYANLYKKRLEETTKKLSQAYQRIAELEVARDEILGLQNNTKYTFTMTAELDYGDGGFANNANNSFEFSFYFYYQAPIITDAQFYSNYDKTLKDYR